jgi:methylated-DNA-[protein]-cysteine S-methyltransferase
VSEKRLAEAFVMATEARDGGLAALAVEAEMAVAGRLRATAPEWLPDPAFVAGLRGELLAGAGASRAPSVDIHWSSIQTELGLLALAYRGMSPIGSRKSEIGNRARVLFCWRANDEAEAARAVARVFGAAERDEAPPPALERGVRNHLAGRKRFTAVDLSWLPDFQRRVLEKTAEIPRGEVRPYSWVAREIGMPGAVRAVGTALGHNPIPFIIPCHRVVRADGTIGEYSGGGPAMKERVLLMEGVPLDEIRGRLRRGERYVGCKSTNIVCFPSCRTGRRMLPKNAVPFRSIAEAAASGYRPCKVCRPA